MVHAWAADQRLLLGQIAVDDKSNEITAVPKLLEMLSLKGCIVTADAMSCQRAIAAQVIEQGGDYVLALKGNQGSLHDDVRTFLDDPERPAEARHTTVDGEHGRIETRTSHRCRPRSHGSKSSMPAGAGRHRHDGPTREIAGKSTTERSYYLLSTPLSAEMFAAVTRAHWGVENGLHWVLDVIFAYGLGNALTFPLHVGATAVLLGRAADGRRRDAHPAGAPADDLLRRAHALRVDPRRRVARPRRRLGAPARAASRRARRCRGTSASGGASASAPTSSTASARPRCCTSSSRTATATSATAPPASPVPGYEVKLVDDDGEPAADGEEGALWVRGPSACAGYWNQREQEPRDVPRPVDAHRRSLPARRRRLLHLRGRADDMLKVGGIWVSPFEVESALGRARRRARGRGRRPRRTTTASSSRTRSSCCKDRRAASEALGRGAEGVREGAARAVQVPALDRVRRPSCRRRRPARSSASSCASG